jgi:arylsulfatase A-like enzyme
MLEYLDDVMGRLFDFVESSALRRNTYVLVMSDNGSELFLGELSAKQVRRHVAAIGAADTIADRRAYCAVHVSHLHTRVCVCVCVCAHVSMRVLCIQPHVPGTCILPLVDTLPRQIHTHFLLQHLHDIIAGAHAIWHDWLQAGCE